MQRRFGRMTTDNRYRSRPFEPALPAVNVARTRGLEIWGEVEQAKTIPLSTVVMG